MTRVCCLFAIVVAIGLAIAPAAAQTYPDRLVRIIVPQLLPEVPTMIESGFPGFVVRPFFGIVAPAGTPAPIVDKLNDAINATMTSQEMQAALDRLDARAGAGTAAEFATYMANDRTRWLDLLRAANLGGD